MMNMCYFFSWSVCYYNTSPKTLQIYIFVLQIPNNLFKLLHLPHRIILEKYCHVTREVFFLTVAIFKIPIKILKNQTTDTV